MLSLSSDPHLTALLKPPWNFSNNLSQMNSLCVCPDLQRATPDFLSPRLATLVQLLGSSLSVFMSTSCLTVAKLLEFHFHDLGDRVVGLPTATVLPESFPWGHGLLAGLPLPVSFLQIWPMYIWLSSLRCSSKQVTSARSFHKPPLPSELHANSSPWYRALGKLSLVPSLPVLLM